MQYALYHHEQNGETYLLGALRREYNISVCYGPLDDQDINRLCNGGCDPVDFVANPLNPVMDIEWAQNEDNAGRWMFVTNLDSSRPMSGGLETSRVQEV